MEICAILRGIRLSDQKGRLVADQIRGLSVSKALDILTFSSKKSARHRAAAGATASAQAARPGTGASARQPTARVVQPHHDRAVHAATP